MVITMTIETVVLGLGAIAEFGVAWVLTTSGKVADSITFWPTLTAL